MAAIPSFLAIYRVAMRLCGRQSLPGLPKWNIRYVRHIQLLKAYNYG